MIAAGESISAASELKIGIDSRGVRDSRDEVIQRVITWAIHCAAQGIYRPCREDALRLRQGQHDAQPRAALDRPASPGNHSPPPMVEDRRLRIED